MITSWDPVASMFFRAKVELNRRFVLNRAVPILLLIGLLVTVFCLPSEAQSSGTVEGVIILPTDAPGITQQLIPVAFSEGVNQYALYFDDVEIPADHVVGEVDGGAVVMFQSLNPERILAAAMCSAPISARGSLMPAWA